jgi:hypothetical protein
MLVVNLEYVANVELDVPLSFELNPERLCYMMQCLHLNFSFTDGLDELFHFGQDKPCVEVDEGKFVVTVHCPGLRAKFSDAENKQLVELQSQGVEVDAHFYWNGSSIIKVKANNPILHDFDMSGNKVPALYSKEKNEDLFLILKTRTFKRDALTLTEYKCRMEMNKQIFLLRLNTLYLLLHNLYTSIPDYEIITFKPNNCIFVLKFRL